jgi:hypothetical protein
MKKKQVLLYCHMREHGLQNIKKTLKFKNVLFSFNDVYGNPSTDILIDLSRKVHSEAYLQKHYKKYDCIYLVNCHYKIYIQPRKKDFRLPLFINLSKLLKPNGVLITIFANHALHLITNKRGPNQFIYNIKYKKNMDREYKKHYLQNLRNIQQEHIVNKIMRRKLKMFLINNKLPLNLLSLQSNKKYVRSAIWYSRVDDFFIMKKML